jgi:hypothetical protein
MQTVSRAIIKDQTFSNRIENIIKQNSDKSSESFLNSLFDFANKNGGLTANQLRAFEKIESHFSPDNIKAHQDWVQQYDEEKKKLFMICVAYYHKQTFFSFGGVIEKAMSDSNFIPTKKQYESIVCNKYANFVIQNTIDKPKFAVKDLVKIKKIFKNSCKMPEIYEGKFAIVISNDLPIKYAIKGGKRYSVLPFGSTKVYEIDERGLTVFKEGKKK